MSDGVWVVVVGSRFLVVHSSWWWVELGRGIWSVGSRWVAKMRAKCLTLTRSRSPTVPLLLLPFYPTTLYPLTLLLPCPVPANREVIQVRQSDG